LTSFRTPRILRGVFFCSKPKESSQGHEHKRYDRNDELEIVSGCLTSSLQIQLLCTRSTHHAHPIARDGFTGSPLGGHYSGPVSGANSAAKVSFFCSDQLTASKASCHSASVPVRLIHFQDRDIDAMKKAACEKQTA
jgi:hypothetical protein